MDVFCGAGATVTAWMLGGSGAAVVVEESLSTSPCADHISTAPAIWNAPTMKATIDTVMNVSEDL